MSKIKIELPENFSFSTRIDIRITDLNYGNHVGNQVFFELIHEARVQFLAHYGFTELNLNGAGSIMANAAIEFKAELVYGDEIEVEVAAAEFSRVGFDLYYKLSAWRDNEKRLAAKAVTALVCFDYVNKKVIALPGLVKEKLTTPT